jgi:hypothetical protein
VVTPKRGRDNAQGKLGGWMDQEFGTSSGCNWFEPGNVEWIGNIRNVNWSKQIIVDKTFETVRGSANRSIFLITPIKLQQTFTNRGEEPTNCVITCCFLVLVLTEEAIKTR